MNPVYYMLTEDHKLVKTYSILAWGKNRRDTWKVAQTNIGKYNVSTVFLGIDHRMSYGHNPDTPIVFETMVFKGDHHDLECERYATYDEAVAGHETMCKLVKEKYHEEKYHEEKYHED